eukprot:GHVL01007106.1.p1 GENE.GHVL01007106.1~~GHVL01007106.1.p1  ORF type:complete len:363 (+),score=105.93 GHVL01007106.1:45-1133(+)
MEKSKKILNLIDDFKKSGGESLNLEFLDIESLTPYIFHLKNIKNLKSLHLFGNLLTDLENIFELKNIEYLDVSENKFINFENILKNLKQLPSLTHLSITGCDLEKIKFFLPNLKTLNGQSLSEIDETSIGGGLQQSELENVASMYDRIRCLMTSDDDDELDGELAAEFDCHVEGILGELAVKSCETDDEILLRSENILSQYNMYNICYTKLIDYVQSKDVEFHNILNDLFIEQSRCFKIMYNCAITRCDGTHCPSAIKLQELATDKERLQHQITDLNEKLTMVSSVTTPPVDDPLLQRGNRSSISANGHQPPGSASRGLNRDPQGVNNLPGGGVGYGSRRQRSIVRQPTHASDRVHYFFYFI